MPPLSHHPDKSKPFDMSKSEVVAWILKQPDIQQWLFNTLCDRGLIKFNPKTGLWQGVNKEAKVA